MKLFSAIGKLLKKLKPLVDVIIAGREAGLWSKTSGPTFQTPQGFVGLKSAESVKVSNGMSHYMAGLYSVAVGIAISAAQGLDFSLLLSSPKQFAVSFMAAFLSGWALYLQRPGQASAMLGSSSALRAEAERFDSLKIDVPLRVDGGK